MKIFTGPQIHELDQYTIEHEPIRSIDLMERAAKAITRAITETWSNITPVVVFAGPGDNGGDALAVARMLADQYYKVSVYLFNVSHKLSENCAINRQRIIDGKRIKDFSEITDEFDPPALTEEVLVVDGLFGSGLNKPLVGGFASLVKYINQSPSEVVSIDMPSGLMTEDNTYNVRANIIKANMTLTLQHKKLAFLFSENQQFIGKLKILDIRLSEEGARKIEAHYTMLEENDIRGMLLPRNDFAHKGD
ncbi:MAG: NAD(P)H-hydrate epimerase, partial [Prevotella sp.]|nr:NAD(P)H-hydrate epimerase [Prevotella sp.]